MICVGGFKRCYYPILTSVIVDYKEQVLITGIKTNMQCSICHISPQEREKLTKTWPPRTHKSIWSQLEKQENDPPKQRDKVSED